MSTDIDDEDSLEMDTASIVAGLASNDPAHGPHLFFDRTVGCLVGVNPKGLRTADMRRMGVEPLSPMQAIRNKCLDCANTESEVRRCGHRTCPLWPFRMKSNPFRAEMSEERKAEASARMRALHGRADAESSDDEDLDSI